MNIDEAIKNAIEIAEIQYIHSVSQRERERIADTIEAITVLQKKRKKYRWHDLRKSPNDLPEIEHEVVVAYTTPYTNGSAKTARAVYEDGSITQPESAFDWEEYVGNDGECDYSEEKDEYMIPTGWFESHWYGEDCHEMHEAEIIAWREIELFEEV